MKDLETIILPVLEMSCAVCANNVENTVKGLPGVEEASVNFAANTLSVKYHPSLITPQKMREAVQEAGYDLVVEERIRRRYRKRWHESITGSYAGIRSGRGYFPFRWPCWEWCLCIRPAVTGS